MDIDNVLRWAPLAAEIAPLYGLSVTTILAVIAVETGWTGDPSLVHPKVQATGLMQVVPSPVIKGRPGIEELKDPRTNINWGLLPSTPVLGLRRQFVRRLAPIQRRPILGGRCGVLREILDAVHAGQVANGRRAGRERRCHHRG